MWHRRMLRILLQGLTVLWFCPSCGASSLGMTVHVVPLGSSGGRMVRAHFSVIAHGPCPSLSGVCVHGKDCVPHLSSFPFKGIKPNPGWCVRQWQNTVPSNFSSTISLGKNTQFFISMKTEPKIRANSQRLNQPPFAALPLPLRARENCPNIFRLSVKDVDGDRVRCRFARRDQDECITCTKHSFIQLHEEQCILSFTGEAAAGTYFIYLMVEDFIPFPQSWHFANNKPLSAVPMHLSLNVEKGSSSCADRPTVTGHTPGTNSMLYVLPYHIVQMDFSFSSQTERVLEIAVTGPPELLRYNYTVSGSSATLSVAWVRAQNALARLLPICVVANTQSLQSELICVWLYQRQIRELPAGTELHCGKTEMTLVLPVTSLLNIKLDELQLNSGTCPVSYNATHLTARIPLTGCGTEILHSGSELIYTNTLKSVRPFTVVSRMRSLLLPLACRIPGVQAIGPNFQSIIPTEEEAFGHVAFWLEFHPPGEGPMSKFTARPRFRQLRKASRRQRRDVESAASNSTLTLAANSTTCGSISRAPLAIGSRLNQLDLHVMSNCSIQRARLMVSNCRESETEGFAVSQPILDQGCIGDNIIEIVTTNSTVRIFRLNLCNTKGTKMYFQCSVNLCVTTQPSQVCPDPCSDDNLNSGETVANVLTKNYSVRSGPVSLTVTTAEPSTTNTATSTAAATTAATTTTPTATTTTPTTTTTTTTTTPTTTPTTTTPTTTTTTPTATTTTPTTTTTTPTTTTTTPTTTTTTPTTTTTTTTTTPTTTTTTTTTTPTTTTTTTTTTPTTTTTTTTTTPTMTTTTTTTTPTTTTTTPTTTTTTPTTTTTTPTTTTTTPTTTTTTPTTTTTTPTTTTTTPTTTTTTPITITTTSTATTNTTTTMQNTTTSHAPEEASAIAASLILTSLSMFLQNICLS